MPLFFSYASIKANLKIVRRAGLHGTRLHDLRHTHATLMLASGVNVKALSQSLGHSNVSITLGIYSHLLPGTGKSAAEQFDNLLNPWLEKNPLPFHCQMGDG